MSRFKHSLEYFMNWNLQMKISKVGANEKFGWTEGLGQSEEGEGEKGEGEEDKKEKVKELLKHTMDAKYDHSDDEIKALIAAFNPEKL